VGLGNRQERALEDDKRSGIGEDKTFTFFGQIGSCQVFPFEVPHQ